MILRSTFETNWINWLTNMNKKETNIKFNMRKLFKNRLEITSLITCYNFLPWKFCVFALISFKYEWDTLIESWLVNVLIILKAQVVNCFELSQRSPWNKRVPSFILGQILSIGEASGMFTLLTFATCDEDFLYAWDQIRPNYWRHHCLQTLLIFSLARTNALPVGT